MTVSDKMVNAVKSVFHLYIPDRYKESLARQSIRVALDAAWTTFDPNNPDTWPKSDVAPSGWNWLLFRPDHIGKFELGVWKGRETIVWKHCVRYCDPADIMPE